jgi:hypothetical protein
MRHPSRRIEGGSGRRTIRWPVIVDGAVYRDGRRVAEPHNFAELHAACSAGDAIA